MAEPIGEDLLQAIDAVEELIHNAPPVPLTDYVRVNQRHLSTMVTRIDECLPWNPGSSSDTQELHRVLGRLRSVVDAAKPVPLTRWHRVDRNEVYDQLDQLRAHFRE